MDWFKGKSEPETMVFTCFYHQIGRAFRLKFSHHPILWHGQRVDITLPMKNTEKTPYGILPWDGFNGLWFFIPIKYCWGPPKREVTLLAYTVTAKTITARLLCIVRWVRWCYKATISASGRFNRYFSNKQRCSTNSNTICHGQKMVYAICAP